MHLFHPTLRFVERRRRRVLLSLHRADAREIKIHPRVQLRWSARQMFEHDPNYAGAHEALALAAQHRGDALTARAERALAAKYWHNADPDLKK